MKMDHHCPWIYNCVGLKNHKHFILLLFYVSVASLFVAITMAWSVRDVVDKADPPLADLFIVLFGESLGAFVALICSGFFGFHLYLTVKALTTIEYCEKQSGKSNPQNQSIFSKGVYGNFQEVLGKNPLIWLIPFHPDRGDGLSFDVDLTKFGDREGMAEGGVSSAKKLGISTPATVDDDGGTGGRGGDERSSLLTRR